MKCPICGDPLQPFLVGENDDQQLNALLSLPDFMTQGDFFMCVSPDDEGGHMIAIFRSPIYLEASVD